jgi:uncharacterized membrane protein YphA (DoxX/SURF4 family)
MNFSNWKKYSPLVLRICLALVFLWFGVSQLVNPESFLGYVPTWMYPHELTMNHDHPLNFMHNLPNDFVHYTIMLNGAFETIFGFMLLLGYLTRISALLLSGHLVMIAFGMGYNDIAIRDLGLAVATFSVFLHGEDDWCLRIFKK